MRIPSPLIAPTPASARPAASRYAVPLGAATRRATPRHAAPFAGGEYGKHKHLLIAAGPIRADCKLKCKQWEKLECSTDG